nr:NAD-dependent DNA ligase LigA [Campylobacter sp.]
MNYDEYLKAVETLNSWARAYYTLDNPIATDSEYDELYQKIEIYERQNPQNKVSFSPTNRVGGEILESFEKSNHIAQMWSMEDIFDFDELLAWLERGEKSKFDFYIEPKFDGASLNLLYENGELIKATTRGDGTSGENVTNNAKVISSIPLKIDYKDRIEIRGEVVITKSDFDLINAKRQKNGENLLSNPRNAASGSLRQLDSAITKSRKLKFYPWGVGANSLNFATHDELMRFVRDLGFLRDPFCGVVNGAEQIQKAYLDLNSQREQKPIMLDGMVIRINLRSKENDLGYTVKFPKFMVAYKFPPLEKTTRLKDVIWQVGRTGAITPVAVVEPVNIDGAIVKNATLHNFDEITRLNLMKNDVVTIIRSGDVIPKLTSVYKDRRDGTQTNIQKPQICPECGSELFDDGAILKCQNLSCKARVLNSLIYFASKKCMNIDGLGEAIISLLFENNKIKEIADIYRLKESDFSNLEGFKDKKISNLLNAINASKSPNLDKFITSLGCELIGEVAAKKIAQIYPQTWLDLKYEDLINLDGFGEAMARSYSEFIALNRQKIIELLNFITPQNLEKIP